MPMTCHKHGLRRSVASPFTGDGNSHQGPGRAKLSTTADDAQLANIDLPNIPQKQQRTLQMSKMMSDTTVAVPGNIG